MNGHKPKNFTRRQGRKGRRGMVYPQCCFPLPSLAKHDLGRVSIDHRCRQLVQLEQQRPYRYVFFVHEKAFLLVIIGHAQLCQRGPYSEGLACKNPPRRCESNPRPVCAYLAQFKPRQRQTGYRPDRMEQNSPWSICKMDPRTNTQKDNAETGPNKINFTCPTIGQVKAKYRPTIGQVNMKKGANLSDHRTIKRCFWLFDLSDHRTQPRYCHLYDLLKAVKAFKGSKEKWLSRSGTAYPFLARHV